MGDIFLKAIFKSAQDAIQTTDELVNLHDRNADLVNSTGKAAKTVMEVFICLEKSPIIEITKTSKDLGLSFNATANAVRILKDLDILKQTANFKRIRVFAYEEYLQILRKDT